MGIIMDPLNISFKPPFHVMCVEHQAILRSINSPTLSWIDFDQFSLSEMPDVIVLGDKNFKYSGTSDGRGFYLEQKVQ